MNKIKILAGVGLAVAFALSAAVPQAEAYEANILSGENLTVGSTGQNVVVLQSLLSEMGYMSIPYNMPLGYFGNITKAALASYQAAQSVYPSVGYFGPMSKITMHQQFAAQGWLKMLGW